MTTKAKLDGKKLALLFFTEDDPKDSKIWTCACGRKIKQKGSGYTNLCHHIKAVHEAILPHAKEGLTRKLLEELLSQASPYSEDAVVVHAWLEFQVKSPLPLHFCEASEFPNFTSHRQLTTGRLSKIMSLMTPIVTEKIIASVPRKVCLVVDEYIDKVATLVSVYVSFCRHTDGHSKTALLGFSRNYHCEAAEGDFQVAELVIGLLEKYKIQHEKIVALVAKPSEDLRSLCERLDCFFIECWNHRFNQTVDGGIENVLRDVYPLVLRIEEQMSGLRGLRCKSNTDDRKQAKNLTHVTKSWKSTLDLLNEYLSLRTGRRSTIFMEYLHLPKEDEERIMKSMGNLSDIAKALATVDKEGTTFAQANAVLDELTFKHPEMKKLVVGKGGFNGMTAFERGVAKIQHNQVSQMSEDEMKVTEVLRTQKSDTSVEGEKEFDRHSIASQAMERVKKSHTGCRDDYIPVDFILPSSNLTTRLFSHFHEKTSKSLCSKFILVEDEKIYLLANEAFWEFSDVDRTLKEEHIDEETEP